MRLRLNSAIISEMSLHYWLYQMLLMLHERTVVRLNALIDLRINGAVERNRGLRNFIQRAGHILGKVVSGFERVPVIRDVD